MSIDLEAIRTEFLNLCGSCDAGIPSKCTCSDRDFRPVMLELVREVERLHAELNNLADDCTDLAAEHETPRMFAAVTTRCRHIAAGTC